MPLLPKSAGHFQTQTRTSLRGMRLPWISTLSQRVPLPRPLNPSHNHLPSCHLRRVHVSLYSNPRRPIPHLPRFPLRRRYGFGALSYCYCRWNSSLDARGRSIHLGCRAAAHRRRTYITSSRISFSGTGRAPSCGSLSTGLRPTPPRGVRPCPFTGCPGASSCAGAGATRAFDSTTTATSAAGHAHHDWCHPLHQL